MYFNVTRLLILPTQFTIQARIYGTLFLDDRT